MNEAEDPSQLDRTYSLRWTDAAKESREKLPGYLLETAFEIQDALAADPRSYPAGELTQVKKNQYVCQHPDPPLNVVYEIDPSNRVIEVQFYMPPSFPGGRKTIFISYSHLDKLWKAKLREALAQVNLSEEVEFWDDDEIRPSEMWKKRIQDELQSAIAAILLVSPNFLNSRFVGEFELPKILSQASDRRTKILWIHVEPGEVPTDITQFQSLNKTPLLNLEEDDLLEEALKGIARKVKEELEN